MNQLKLETMILVPNLRPWPLINQIAMKIEARGQNEISGRLKSSKHYLDNQEGL